MKALLDRIDFTRLLTSFLPFLSWLPNVNKNTLKPDAYAALSSAIFCLPQSLAFALIAGLPPEFGLYSAIIAPIITSFFGSSWHAVSGPTVATSIVLMSILSEYAVPQSPQFIGLAITLTLIAGIIQLILGFARLGQIVSFISHTVIVGFSSGAALLIISSQISQFLGLHIEKQDNFLGTLKATFEHLSTTNFNITLLSFCTLLCIFVCKRYFKHLPYLLIAMVFGAIAAFFINLFNISNSTGIEMIGALPSGLPSITIPDLSWFQTRELLASAFALATLGLIQSVSISKTIASKTGQRIDPNQEFSAQGIANICCSFTSGFFASNSFTRSAINYSAGAKTPVANLISSGFIILFLLFLSNITSYLPAATMSVIIIVIGWGLIDFGHIKKIVKTSRMETLIFLATLLSTLLLNLEFAIYSGMILSLIVYLQKTSRPKVNPFIIDKLDPYQRIIKPTKHTHNPYPELGIFRIEGPIFFGSTDNIRTRLERHDILSKKHVLILFNRVNLLDISGCELLLQIRNQCHQNQGELYLAELSPETRKYLRQSPYWELLGKNRYILNYKTDAITKILTKINE